MKKDSNAIDRIDRKILATLQREGRISNIELASRVNLSPTPCLERVRRLEKHGFIKEYVAHLDPQKLNAGVIAYIQVSLQSTATAELEKFNEQMIGLEEVMECSMVAGGFDYLLKIRVADMLGYRRFLGEKLAAIRGVSQTHTYVVMEEVKSTHILPV